jgi:hypothetical protein
MVGHTTITVLGLQRRSKATPKDLFGYVDLKKKRVGYPSVMDFEGRLASDPIMSMSWYKIRKKIADVLFANFIQRTYADDVWVPSDPGPYLVQDYPPFGALQFTVDEVQSVLLELDVSKGTGSEPRWGEELKNCASSTFSSF